MSKPLAPFNSNVVETDFINLDSVLLDLNNLELARIVITDNGAYGILHMKNGTSYVVDSTVIANLEAYSR